MYPACRDCPVRIKFDDSCNGERLNKLDNFLKILGIAGYYPRDCFVPRNNAFDAKNQDFLEGFFQEILDNISCYRMKL